MTVFADKFYVRMNSGKSFIKHTLMLPYPNITEDETVSDLMKKCLKCCGHLFAEDPYQSYHYFWGMPLVEEPQFYTALSTMDSCKKGNRAFDSSKHISNLWWKDSKIAQECLAQFSTLPCLETMIIQHCVLNTYHSVISALLSETTIKAYYLINTVKHMGVQELFQKGLLQLQHDTVVTKPLRRSPIGEQASFSNSSSKASDFSRNTISHIKTLPCFKHFFLETMTKPFDYYIQTAGLWHSICRVPSNSLKILTQELSSDSIQANVSALSSIITKNMDRPSQKSKAYLADNLYHHYLFERIFKVNLFNCLLQNIERVNAKLGYTVDGGETLRTLCKCLNLPNTFSRTYMLQYAFDQFFIAPDSSTDFWSLLKDMHPVSEIKGQIKGFQYPMWVTQYGYFCDYLSKYIIPVYEWCFTNLVMDYISLKFPVSTSCSHTKQLYEAMLFLAEYMGSHYQSFITPLGKTKAPKTINKKVLPLILPNNMYYPHLLPDTIKKIQHFFWQSDLSFRNASGKYLLDSPFLTPDFFLKKQSGAYSSLHNITTFYSNLVRDLYFD